MNLFNNLILYVIVFDLVLAFTVYKTIEFYRSK